MNSNDLSYIAGFFDGEGSVYVTTKKRNYGRGRYYALNVTAVNTNPEVIEWINQMFPGHTRTNYRNGGNPKNRDIYFWSRCSKLAAEFLRTIQPYSRVKSDQIALGLELDSMMDKGRRISDEEYERMEQIRSEVSRLNRGDI